MDELIAAFEALSVEQLDSLSRNNGQSLRELVAGVRRGKSKHQALEEELTEARTTLMMAEQHVEATSRTLAAAVKSRLSQRMAAEDAHHDALRKLDKRAQAVRAVEEALVKAGN